MDGSSEYQVTVLMGIGTIGTLIIAIAFILFIVHYQRKMVQEKLKLQQLKLDHQYRMMQATLESQESERRKLAGDLHDSIGGMLSAIRMGISTLAKSMPDHQQAFLQNKQMLDDTISSVRQISRDLMPSTLEKFGLGQALKELCESIQATALIPVEFNEEGEALDMDKNKELMIFRIVQELLNNAIKHSRASLINVSLIVNNSIYISVEDNGVGFNIDAQRKDKAVGKGLGLYSIENRASLLGAKLSFERERIKGSKITLTLPQRHEAKV